MSIYEDQSGRIEVESADISRDEDDFHTTMLTMERGRVLPGIDTFEKRTKETAINNKYYYTWVAVERKNHKRDRDYFTHKHAGGALGQDNSGGGGGGRIRERGNYYLKIENFSDGKTKRDRTRKIFERNN